MVPKDLQMIVTKSVIEKDMARGRLGKFRYVVDYQNESGQVSRLTNVEGRPLYEAIDEGLGVLFGILVRTGERAGVTISSNVGLADGAKQALMNKYASETEFAAIRFN